jgi:circadian clock protein KaiC
MSIASSPPDKLSTGVVGLDDVLAGGLPRSRLYLVEGGAGSGKTTLALQFLLEGVRLRESVLYVVLAETSEEIRQVAESHGWPFDGLKVFETEPVEDAAEADEQYTVFHPSEVELNETAKAVLEEIERVKPARLAFDSITGLRLLAQTPLRFRQQVLSLKRALARLGCTTILVDDAGSQARDLQLRSIVHGIITLERIVPRYGTVRRHLEVAKLRGVRFRDGVHDFAIRTGGIVIYPRIVTAEHRSAYAPDVVPSGLPGLDGLLGGGLTRGTSTVFMGPSGAGKSALATQYTVAAAARGEKAVLYTFDETLETYFLRSEGLGLDLRRHTEAGRIDMYQVDPVEMSQGEFVHGLRHAVEKSEARVVVIDSLNGYLNALPDKDLLAVQMHELLTYLNQRGVLTLLVLAQHGLVSEVLDSPADISYLADACLLLRYFEAYGEVRRAISAIKKRTGSHERTIRELHLGAGRIEVGDTLSEFQGVLKGVPSFIGKEEKLQDGGSGDHVAE